MLVLGRKVGDSVVLDGKDGRIYIKFFRGAQSDTNNLKIGIEAPDGVRILRGEICPELKDLEAKWPKVL